MLTLLTFIALQGLWKVLICRARLPFGVCYYVNVQFTPRRVINISHYDEQNWIRMSTSNIHLLHFKFQGHLQNKDIKNWCIKLISMKKSEICTISVAIFFVFSSSNFFNLLAIVSCLESTFCDKTIKFQNASFIPAQITKSRLDQSQACFLHTTHLGILKHVSYTQPI